MPFLALQLDCPLRPAENTGVKGAQQIETKLGGGKDKIQSKNTASLTSHANAHKYKHTHTLNAPDGESAAAAI